MKIYYYDMDGNESEIEIKIGNTYCVQCDDYGDTGDLLCEFKSKLKDLILSEDKKNIDELIFENGVIIFNPQYHHNAINIIEN